MGPSTRNLERFIDELRARVIALRGRASWFFWLIVAVLSLGIFGFVSAGLLTTFELSKTVTLLQRQIDTTDKAIKESREESEALQRAITQESARPNSPMLDRLKTQ